MGNVAPGGDSRREGDRLAGAGTGTGSFGTGLLHRLVAHVAEGHDVVVHDPTGGGPILDLLAVALRARRSRVLRFKATGSGRVGDLLAQLTGEPVDGMPDEKTLERSFELLCTPDAGCSRIVLLVGNAHLMGRKEFRYLHLAAKSGPLQFVLAATDNPLGPLDGDLVLLHNRLAAFEPLVIEPGTPLAVAIPSTPRPAAVARPEAAPGPAAPGPEAPRHGTRHPRRLAELGAVAAIASAVTVFAGVGLHLLHAAPRGIAVVEASAAPASARAIQPALVAGIAAPTLPTAAPPTGQATAGAQDPAPGVRPNAPVLQPAPARPNRTGMASMPQRPPQQAVRARAAMAGTE